MKNYIILMREYDAGIEIQKHLIKVGFTWSGDSEAHHPAEVPYFLFIEGADSSLSHSSNLEYVGARLQENSNLMALNDLHFDQDEAFSLEGAKLPEKMIIVNGKEFSESTLIAALKQYVEY